MSFFNYFTKGDYIVAGANKGPKEFITSDDQIFKTVIEVGSCNPREYDLETLLKAEGMVAKGRYKNLGTALNAVKGLIKNHKKKVTTKKLKDLELDEYGLNPEVYSEQQVSFIHNKIKEFEAVYDTSTPFGKETITEMAKNRLKMSEIEAKMINNDDPIYIKAKTDLRKDFSSMAADLKILPSQKKTEDRSKGRTSLAEIVLRYEARKKSGRMETSEKTKEMKQRLSEERALQKDGKFQESSDN